MKLEDYKQTSEKKPNMKTRRINNYTIKGPNVDCGLTPEHDVVIKNLLIPEYVQKIESGYLNGRTAIRNFIVDKNNKYYTCVDGVLFTKDMKRLVAYPRRHNKLFSYVVPQGVEVIEEEAFANQQYLTNITLPDSLKVISRCAFISCKRLQEVHIPASVEEISYMAFRLMPKLRKVLVDSSNPYFFDDDGVVYTRDPQALVCYPNGKRDKTYKILDNTIGIQPHVFFNQMYIEEIEMPDSLTVIGDKAFYSAEQLSSIKFSPNIKELGCLAFAICSKLTEIEWQDSFTQQDNLFGVFSGCERLSIVKNFPDELCARMFYSKKYLREHGMKPRISYLFDGTPFEKEIAKRLSKYKKSDV